MQRRPRPQSIRKSSLLIAAAAGLASAAGASGDTVYWDNVTSNWDTLSNWTTSPTATTPDPTTLPDGDDDVVFNRNSANAGQTVTLVGSQSALSMTIRSTGTSTFVSGGTAQNLTIGAGGLTVAAGTGNVVIGSSTAGNNVHLWGSSFIEKLSTNTLTLRGNNSNFSGPIYIKAGTLQAFTNPNSLGTGAVYLGDSVVGANAVLESSMTFGNAISVSSGAGTRTIRNADGQSAGFNNVVTINKDTVITFVNSGLMRFNNVVTGTGNLSLNISGRSLNGIQFGGSALEGGAINIDGTITLNASADPAAGANAPSPVSIQGASYLGASVDGIVQNNEFHVFYLKTSNTVSGNVFAGTVAANAGTIRLENALALNANNVVTLGTNGNLALANVSPTVAGLNSAVGGAVTLSSGASAHILTLGGASGDYAYAGNISGATPGMLSLNKTGNSTQTLSGSYNYGGTTTIAGGTLRVTGTHTGAGAYTVMSGGTLGGGGTGTHITTASNAGVTVLAGGKLAPGTTAGGASTLRMNLGTGTLNISGAVTAANSQSLQFDINAGSADKIEITGGLNIGSGVLQFDDFAFNGGAGLTENATYTLIDATALTGTLAGDGLSGTFSGYGGTISLAGDDVILTVTSVPEPASLSLVGLAGFGLLSRRRRVKRVSACDVATA